MARTPLSIERLDNSSVVKAVRQGLVMTIPMLMIGSVALVLTFLPISPYQTFLSTFAGGFLLDFFGWLNQVTFGILAIALNISISVCYARQKTTQAGVLFGALFSSLSAFMIFVGLFTEHFNMTSFGAQGMFTAIVSAVGATALFCKLREMGLLTYRFYTVGADNDFNNILSVILPAAMVMTAAYFANLAIAVIFGAPGLEQLFHASVDMLFRAIESNTVRALVFVVLSGLFWFFGIHGTNVLESVAQNIFVLDVEAGIEGLFSKPFIDVFVFMGGCGATVSLLVAILWCSGQKNIRSLAKMAAVPMLFNINELMVFGMPIVLNATFFIPFLLTPVLFAGTSYAAVAVGLVPYPDTAVQWVTPVLASGYLATGSIAGTLLQVFNIALGAVVYRYFLLRYEKRVSARIRQDLGKLIDTLRSAEDEGEAISLLDQRGAEGNVANMLAEDLRHVMRTGDSLVLHYQPQYDHEGRCFGAEALLRWDHPRCGSIYPPLVIGLAEEIGRLGNLERQIFEMACRDITQMKEAGVCPPKISVNATAASLRDREFATFLAGLIGRFPAVQDVLCIELTEQMSFLLSEAAENKLQDIRGMGIRFAVDDFAMGHTSFKYLQSNLFDLVKLDGSLTRDMMRNARSREIISTIVGMSRSMHFQVLAEYVETREQQQVLEKMGCTLYQGYLYSPAVPRDKLVEQLKNKNYIAT